MGSLSETNQITSFNRLPIVISKRLQQLGIIGFFTLLAAVFSGPSWAALVCSTGQDGILQITEPLTRVNVYYPSPPPPPPPIGEISVPAGSTSIPIDGPQASNLDPRISQTISAGDILVIVQMQGADISTADNHFVNQHLADAGSPAGGYGDGAGADGFEQAGYLPTNLTVGHYEFLVATGPVSGGSVPVEGASGGGALANSYSSSDTVTGNSGFRRYQVIKVPQFVNLDVTASGGIVPDRWNGRWGGIAAINVQDTLNVSGSINATGRGFRGGQFFKNRNLGDQVGTETGLFEEGQFNFGFKGEGIAGSPSRLFSRVLLAENSATGGEETGPIGYPGTDDLGNTSGYQDIYQYVRDDTRPDALFGRTGILPPDLPAVIYETNWTRDAGQGAPGNAGSGAGFSEDGGGGGGGHVKSGGNGGRGTNNKFSYGIGGGTFFEHINGGSPTPARLAMGGGGGGSNGNDLVDFNLAVSSGQAGGGIIFVRAANITGSGTISANGDSGGTARSEGGGGGGAGGTILVHTGGSAIGVSLSAKGGAGGSSENLNDGAGGGGSGGVIYLSNTTHTGGAGAENVAGGAGGTSASGGGNPAFNGSPGGVGLAKEIEAADPAVPLFGCKFISLGIAKRVSSMTLVSGKTYDVTFDLVIENLTSEDAPNIQITDDLAAAFPGVTSISVTNVNRNGLSAPATAYDGQGQNNILGGTDTLAANSSQNLNFTVRVDFGSQSGPFFNQAEITTALIPEGFPQALDRSDDGTDPDPDGDGDPSETVALGGDSEENDPTVISLTPTPVISVSKAVGSVTDLGDNIAVRFRMVVRNIGNVSLNNLQLFDDVSPQFGSAFVRYVAGSSQIVSSTATTNPVLSNSLPNLFNGTSGQLDPGQQVTVDFIAEANPNAVGAPNPLTNQARVTGANISSPTQIATDLSDSGTDPSTPNPGAPGDSGGSDDPTPVVAPNGSEVPASILLTKSADRREAVIGDVVGYTVDAENKTVNNLSNLTIEDNLPGGFRYVAESAIVIRAGADGKLGTSDDTSTPINPTGADPINFNGLNFAPSETIRLQYYTRVSTGVVAGEYTNVATTLQAGNPVSNQARATVVIVQDSILQKTTIIGKVFDDRNENGIQDRGERGIPGVRLATVEGLLIETDQYGRYHIADVDGGRLDRGRNYIVKVDPSTLPQGTEFVTENPRVLRITQSLVSKFNFGVKLPEPGRVAYAGKNEIVKSNVENTVKIADVIDPIYFDSGKSFIRPEHIKQLKNVLALLGDKANVQIHIVGHTDSQKLALRTARKYTDNQGLSEARAAETARIFEQRLGLSTGSITTSGRGKNEPIASNETAEGRQQNRRAEIEIVYDNVETKVVEEKVFVASTPGSNRITLPDGGEIWAVEDPTANDPRLSVMAHGPLVLENGLPTGPVSFSHYSNYKNYIDRWEIAIYSDRDRDLVKPIATLSGKDVSFMNKATWDGKGFNHNRQKVGAPLTYVLRVYDAKGHMDETAPQFLKTVDSKLVKDLEHSDGLAIYGQTQLERQTIPMRGSRVRLQGININPAYHLVVDGAAVPISDKKSFVIEQHLATGMHKFDLEVTTPGEEKWTHEVPINVTGKYLFLVGLANLTVGSNNVSGNTEALAVDDHFDEKVFVDGRVAMYLKGKIKGKYLLTAQVDTTEDELKNMGSNLARNNPNRIFRKLDSDRYYPVYGDDSTTISDVDTQGAGYVRVDWDKSHFVWGNYHTGFTGNEFAQYNRSLYGAQLQHRSTNTTAFGDHKVELNGFGSEAQTAFAHNEFNATGGSLYYLRDKDVVEGSEKVWVEVRSRDSERVIENITLEEGRDYEIDYIQGRIILSRPLTQVANSTAPSIIKDRPLDGNNVFLLSDYEYVPDFEVDKITAGGRAKVWATDNLGIGATVVNEDRDGTDYKMYGADLTLKLGKGTYVKGEYATTDARQTDADFISQDGGLSFADQNLNIGNDDVDGDAISIEGQVNLAEVTDGKTNGSVSAWYKDRDAGFSSARVDDGIDTTDTGLEAQFDVTDKFSLTGRGSYYDRDGLLEETKISLQGDYTVTNKFGLGAEIRHEDIDNFLTGEDGSATLLGVSAQYYFTEQTQVYGSLQGAVSDSDRYTDNDAVTVGINSQVNDRLALKGEVSVGDRGNAYVAGAEYAVNDKVKLSLSGGFGDGATSQIGTNYTTASGLDLYGTYTIDPDLTGSKRSTVTLGSRRKYANGLSLFSENQFINSDQQDGVARVYGLDYQLSETWSLSGSAQSSKLEVANGEDIKRNVGSIGAQYSSNSIKGSTRLEYRKDEGSVNTTQWLTSNALEWQQNPELKWLGKLNLSLTEDDDSDAKDGLFTELDLAAAYRPVYIDKLNILAKYSFLYDLPTDGQINTYRPNDERSHVLSLEGLYDLTQRWELGGKLAWKRGDVRLGRDTGGWIETGARLAVARARYHFIKNWDGLVEYRWLQSETEDDMRHGALLGLYRHLGNNVKLGAGYNFTKFDDDLTSQDYDVHGWFLDIVGKF